MAISIIMYHQIRSELLPLVPVDENYWDAQYSLTADQFRVQMARVLSGGYRSCTLDAWGKELFSNPNNRQLLITFDDGWASDYHTAFPILQECGLTATLFPAVSNIGKPGYLTWAQLYELCNYGMAVGSHTMTHRFLCDLPDEEIRWELERSKAELEDHLGRAVRHLALPGGRHHPRLHEMAQAAGYSTVSTSIFGINQPSTDPFALKRIAIKGSMTSERFEQLLQQRPYSLWSEQALSLLRDQMKVVLGTTRYLALRAQIGKLQRYF
jgi:peptidoglycan/xylan/chitin deacetylase (PgdA/CDA1 family)